MPTIDPEVGDYKPGSVRRIKLKHFLTYSYVEFQPGPRMNVVMGPNGTGKSSILCAICLGLGGEPKNLGRADDARSFIMNEKDTAFIEVELTPFPHQPVHVFQRQIERHKGSEKGRGRGASTFYINDEKVNIKAIQEMVQGKYNIMISNLCTFLPQDKVGSFSGYGQEDLLIETEKTLSGSQHMYHTHLKLIEAEEKLSNGANDVDTIRAKLDRLKVENARLEKEKERMEEREQALQQADLIRKKMLWLHFSDLREKFLEFKERKSEIKEKLRAVQAELAPVEEALKFHQRKFEDSDTKYKTLDLTTQRYRQDMNKQAKKYETHDDNTEHVLLELREMDSIRTRKLESLQQAKEKVQMLEETLQTMPSKEQVEKDFLTCHKEKKTVIRAHNDAKSEVSSLISRIKEVEDEANGAQRRLAKVNDEKARRKEEVLRQEVHLRHIVQWLDQNRKIFRHPVYGPIVCEVTAKTEHASAFLEKHVARHVMKSFVVYDKADYDLLYSEVRNKLKIPINIQIVKNGALKPIQRPFSEGKMKELKQKYGIDGYLDEAFTAPDCILQALRSSSQVHKVVYGRDVTNTELERNGLSNFFTFICKPEESLGQRKPLSCTVYASSGRNYFRYSAVISRYSGKPSISQDSFGRARFLGAGTNPQEKKKLEDQIKNLHDKINQMRPDVEEAERKKLDIEAEGQKIMARFDDAKNAKQEFEQYFVKLNNARKKLQDVEQSLQGDDGQAKKEKLKSLMNRIAHGITALEAHANCHNEMMKSTFASAGARITRDTSEVAMRKAMRVFQDKKKEHDECQREASTFQKRLNDMKDSLRTVKAKADAEAPMVDRNGNELPLKQQLEDLAVESLEEAEAALEEVDAKANAYVANDDVIRQYEMRQAQIEETEAQLEQLVGSKDSLVSEIENMRRPWEDALGNSIVKVNALFSAYMGELGCVGEVRLKKSENSEGLGSFRDWGIEIRVSFREGTAAQVLSARVQSGGERSVSTIMYLMALQELMVAPFRCVDEINQGLDERNERMVFKRIVENSTRPPKTSPTDHSGQYFLITPKLLPNLRDMETNGVTALIVFNGPYNFDSPLDWNVDSMLSMRKKRVGSTLEEASDDENSPTNVPTTSRIRKKQKQRSS